MRARAQTVTIDNTRAVVAVLSLPVDGKRGVFLPVNDGTAMFLDTDGILHPASHINGTIESAASYRGHIPVYAGDTLTLEF